MVKKSSPKPGKHQSPDLDKINRILTLAKNTSPYYQQRIPTDYIDRIEDIQFIPVLTSDDLRKCSDQFPSPLLTRIPCSNYVFASGGTTGQPKIIYRSHEENDFNTTLLAKGLKIGGLSDEDIVANLLSAGNLYAGMLQFNQALEKIGCMILPIGDNVTHEILLKYARFFKVSAILAIPTQIISFAHYLEDKKISNVKIPRVITGGEQLYSSARQYLKKVLKVTIFQSTGYTSVDTGAIGYQSALCNGMTYHLHSDAQYLEILDQKTNLPVAPGEYGNIVVTSLTRTLMPLVRYAIGDAGRLLKKQCLCGSKDQLFELAGRGDERIRVGFVFITPELICSHITKIEGLSLHFQINVSLENYMDKITIIVESLQEKNNEPLLKNKLLKSLNTIKYLTEEAESKRIHPIEVIILKPNTIVRNPQTGKIRSIIDSRGQ